MPLYFDIQTRIVREIENLRLHGNPRVVAKKRFDENEHWQNNTIVVARDGEKTVGRTFGANEISFSSVLFMVRGTGGKGRENEETVSDWRDEVYEHFHNKREPLEDLGITGVTPYICRVDFGNDFLSEFWQKRWDVNHMVIWSIVRKLS